MSKGQDEALKLAQDVGGEIDRLRAALTAAHECETALREELEYNKTGWLNASGMVNKAQAALAEAQRERDEALRRSLQCCCVALTAERQKVQELRDWLERNKSNGAFQDVMAKLDALGLTDADRAVGKRG